MQKIGRERFCELLKIRKTPTKDSGNDIEEMRHVFTVKLVDADYLATFLGPYRLKNLATFLGPHRCFNLVCKVLVQKGFRKSETQPSSMLQQCGCLEQVLVY